jgi:hypothetical protein
MPDPDAESLELPLARKAGVRVGGPVAMLGLLCAGAAGWTYVDDGLTWSVLGLVVPGVTCTAIGSSMVLSPTRRGFALRLDRVGVSVWTSSFFRRRASWAQVQSVSLPSERDALTFRLHDGGSLQVSAIAFDVPLDDVLEAVHTWMTRWHVGHGRTQL